MEIKRGRLNEILYERIAWATGLAVALHVFLFAIYATIASFDMWHPFSAIYNLIITFVSPKTWLFWTPSAVTACLVGCSTLSCVTSGTNKLVRSRLDTITGFFSCQAIFKLAAYISLAIVVPISYLYICGTSFVVPCDTNNQLRCASAHALFIASCSTFCGIVTIFGTLKITTDYFKPLIFNAAINIHLRPTLYRTIKKSFGISMKLIPIYMMIFYLGVDYISIPYRLFLNAYNEEGLSIFNLWTVTGCCFLSTVTCTSVLVIKEIMHLCLAQFIELPVTDLVALMETPISAFEEQLIFQELSQLALGRSVIPVGDVFALSQPGGLPHSWNNILRHCLRVIYNFQNQLNEFHLMPQVERTTEPQSAPVTARNSEAKPHGLRRLRSENAPPLPTPQQEYFGDFLEPLVSKILAAVNIGKIAPRPIQFFTAPLPDIQICSLLENSQMVMLASSSLSGLSCRALKEDRFGVMVNDLPTIINTLVTLEESVSRIALPKRKQKSILAKTMHAALSITLKQSIAQIAHAYSSHLDFLRLESPRLAMLKRMVENGQDKEPIKSAKGIVCPF